MNLNLTKEQQLILLGLIISIVVGLTVTAYRHYFTEPAGKIAIEEPRGGSPDAQAPAVMVHVCGAVRREGVYKLKPGDRQLEALKMAGGALPSADLSALNLAETVKDGQKIIVPSKQIIAERVSGDQPAGKQSSDIRSSGTPAQKINLNTASEEKLDSLPGVGKSTAQKIIEYRRTNGPFTRIEQIMEIPRFGKSKFEKIRDRLTL